MGSFAMQWNMYVSYCIKIHLWEIHPIYMLSVRYSANLRGRKKYNVMQSNAVARGKGVWPKWPQTRGRWWPQVMSTDIPRQVQFKYRCARGIFPGRTARKYGWRTGQDQWTGVKCRWCPLVRSLVRCWFPLIPLAKLHFSGTEKGVFDIIIKFW